VVKEGLIRYGGTAKAKEADALQSVVGRQFHSSFQRLRLRLRS
jgi:hypothetical protein